MKAKVKVEFDGRPDDSGALKHFVPGDIVEGDLAATAIKYGQAEVVQAGPTEEELKAQALGEARARLAQVTDAAAAAQTALEAATTDKDKASAQKALDVANAAVADAQAAVAALG